MKQVAVTTDAGGTLISKTETNLVPHSAEVAKNAKGQFTWCVKVYFGDDQKDTIADEIKKITDHITANFPSKPE